MIFFNRKQMIEDLEADMTGSPKETSNTDNSAVSEEANVDESITSEAIIKIINWLIGLG